ncbi:MAG: hypothetical protein PHY59_01110, partial [Methanobacterium sp.]|nr:hypothetical protein [Methanobacterium sp.]
CSLFKKQEKLDFEKDQSFNLLFENIKDNEFDNAILVSEMISFYKKREVIANDNNKRLNKTNRHLKRQLSNQKNKLAEIQPIKGYVNYKIKNISKRLKKKFKNKNLHFYLFIKFKGNRNKFKAYEKIYNALKVSNLFDENYYLKKYPNIKESMLDPVQHYIIFGTKEGKIPSQKFNKIYNTIKDTEWFDESYYLKNYPNLKIRI